MQGDELAAEARELTEQIKAARKRDARKVGLQELRVTKPIPGAKKHVVDVAEDVLWRARIWQTMTTVSCT